MNKLHYKPEQVIIEAIADGPKKKLTWVDRLLYASIVIFLLLIFGSYIVRKSLSMNADGKIILETFQVAYTEPIFIQEHLMIEGDSVKPGDSLFIYSFINQKVNTPNNQPIINEKNEELIRLKSEKKVDEQKLSDIRLELDQLQGTIKETKRQIILGIDPASKLDSLKTLEKILNSNKQHYIKHLQELGHQIAVLSDELAKESLNSETIRLSNRESIVLSASVTSNSYVVNRNGVISSIYSTEGDTVNQAEVVLDIVRFQNPRVLATFPIIELANIEEGAPVKIAFPDGHSTNGLIERVITKNQQVSKTVAIENEDEVGVIVVPIDPIQKHWWFKYRNIGVTITIDKHV